MAVSNKYLEKISSTVGKKSSTEKAVAEGVVGGYLMSKAPSRLIGYHNLYHGTTKETGAKILKEGFDPSKGGTGAAAASGRSHFKTNSTNRVHFTRIKPIAKMFAGYRHDAALNGGKGAEQLQSRDMFNNKGKVIKARVSHGEWQKSFQKDPDMGGKYTAATTTKKVMPKSIVGSAEHKGIAGFATKDKLKGYYSTASGRQRGLRGAGIGVAGAGLLYHAVKSKFTEKK